MEVILLAIVHEPDLTIRPAATPGTWEASTGAMVATVAGWLTGRPTLVVRHPDGPRVTSRLLGMSWRMADGSLVPARHPHPCSDPAEHPERHRLRVCGAMPGVDEWLEVRGAGLKQAYVIPSIPSLEIPAEAVALVLHNRLTLAACETTVTEGRTAGSIPLFRPTQPEPVMAVERGEVWDSAGHRTHVRYEWETVTGVDGLPDRRRVDLDMVVDAEWLRAAEGEVTIDPTVVTNADAQATAWSTQGKWVEMSNGVLWLLVQTGVNTISFYVSQDGGQTWALASSGSSQTFAYRGALSKDEDDNLFLVFEGSSDAYIRLRRGVPNAARTGVSWESPSIVDMTGFGTHPGVVAHKEGTDTKCHIVWAHFPGDASTNNARYRRANVTSGGTITYDTATQSLDNDQPENFSTRPSVRVDPAKNVNLQWTTYQANVSKGVRHRRYTYSSGVWTLQSTQSIDESNFAASGIMGHNVDSQGRAVVAYRRSSDNVVTVRRRGADGTWTTLTGIPTITSPTSLFVVCVGDDVFVLFSLSGLKYAKYTSGTGTWGSIVTLNSDTSCVNVNGARSALATRIHVAATVGTSPYSVISETISLNQPPLAPSGLTRANYDGTQSAAYTWTHNDPDPGDGQSAYQFQLRLNGAGSDLIDSGWVQSATSSRTVAGGTLTNGNTYQWRVRTKDQAGVESPWSDYATFQTGAAPVPTILAPLAGSTVSHSEMNAQWSVGDQASAVVRLYSANGVTLISSLAVTQSSARVRTVTGLANGTSYQISVQVTSSLGITGPEVFSGAYAVSYTPPAEPDNLAAQGVPGRGSILLTWSPPASPTGVESGQFQVSRRLINAADSTYVVLGTVTGYQYEDYAVASGQRYVYRVLSIGTNGVLSDGSTLPLTMAG